MLVNRGSLRHVQVSALETSRSLNVVFLKPCAREEPRCEDVHTAGCTNLPFSLMEPNSCPSVHVSSRNPRLSNDGCASDLVE